MDGAASGNQTGSTNDSGRDDSSNQVSSPSAHRGFSSDEGSGWRSETETSDGNLSLSQYPLDDKSGYDSAHDGGSINDEALSTAITEVSKDFITGNFSPMRSMMRSGDSDSNSDGDHKGLTGDPRGAVYANYPESATGMSDVEWNPYESDYNPEPTPRSSEDGGPAQNPLLDTMASVTSQRGKDSGYSTQTVNTVPSVLQHPDNASSAKSGSDTGSGEDSDKTSGSSQPTSQQFYAIFSDQSRDGGMQVPGGQGPEGQRLTRRDSGEALPEFKSENGQRKLEMPLLVLRKSAESDNNSGPENIHRSQVPEPYSLQANSAPDSRIVVTKPGGSGLNDAPKQSVSTFNSEGGSKARDVAYIPVLDREHLIGLPPTNPESNEQEGVQNVVSENGHVQTMAAPAATTNTVTPAHLSDPQSRSNMSQRVAKLLNDASSLGASLHKQLYSRESLGLGEGDHYHKDRPALEPRPLGTIERPCPVESRPPPPPYDVVQAERKIDEVRESLENQSRSVGSLGSNTQNLSKSEQSMTSSLGEEVAKHLVKNDASGAGSLKLDLKFVTEERDLSNESAAELEALQRYYRQERETERLLEETRARLNSDRSTDSSDSLGHRVQNVLAKTAYVEKMQYPPPEQPRKTDTAYSVVKNPVHIDYSMLQRDLQDIQNSLNQQVGEEAYSSHAPQSRGPDMDRSGESFSSNPESARNRKLLWDHAADFGINVSGAGVFLGTMKNDTETETDTLGLTALGESRPTTDDERPSPDQGRRKVDVVGDQLNSESELDTGNLAPDVEDIIRKYQSRKGDKETLDNSGLASRVFTILTKEPPQKQVFGILEEAMQQERVMMERIANRPKMDSSYDSYESPDGSFIVHDRDIKKQLEWSQMSSLNGSMHPDKTNASELSFLKGGRHAPFNALGNAQKYLSSQIQKTTDRTFDHSINLRTPCRQVIDCYPVYRDDQGQVNPGAAREAWPDQGANQEDNVETKDEEVYHELQPSPVRPPRELDLKDTVTPQLAKERHTRSRSEEAAPLGHDDNSTSLTDRRHASSSAGDDGRPSSSKSARLSRSGSDRQETYGGNSPQLDGSPSSSGGVISPDDSDNSSRRREGSRLRPYRPYGSRDLYYTEDNDDSGSLIDSVATVESTHTGDMYRNWDHSDDTFKYLHDDQTTPVDTYMSNHTDYRSKYNDYTPKSDYHSEHTPKSDYHSGTFTDYGKHDGEKHKYDYEKRDYGKRDIISDVHPESSSRGVKSPVYLSDRKEYQRDYDRMNYTSDYMRDFRREHQNGLGRHGDYKKHDNGYHGDYASGRHHFSSRDYRGSDDAAAPSFPPHYLGSRPDGPKNGGVYSSHRPSSEGLSTIEEKSMADDREKSGTDSGLDRRSMHSGSSRGGENTASTERHPDSGLDLLSGRPGRQDSDQDELGPRNSSKPASADLRSRSDLPLKDKEYRRSYNPSRLASESQRRDERLLPGDDVLGDRMTGDAGTYNHRYRSVGSERSELTSAEVRSKERIVSGMENKDDPLSVTTRSDPGDIFTPHPGLESDLSVYPLDRHSEGRNYYLQDPVGATRSRSKSETDLISISPESHRNSSPVHNTRLMDLSCQPSPIFSHHTTMDSPAIAGGRGSPKQGQALDHMARYTEERLRQRPLEKGRDLIDQGKIDRLDKQIDYNPRLRSRSLDPGETHRELEARDIYQGRSAGQDAYRSVSDREIYQNLRETGRLTTGDGGDEVPKDSYRTRGNNPPIEYVTQAERQRLMSPSWANPKKDQPQINGRVDVTATYCDKTGQPLDAGYSPSADYPLEPGVQIPLQPGAEIIARPLEPGRDFSPVRGRNSDRGNSRGAPYMDLEGDGQFKELEQLPDSDFEDAINEEKEKLLKEKRDKLIRDLEMKARSQHKFVPLVDDESDYDEEFDKRPPSKRVVILRESLEKEYRGSVHPNINDMWQRFKDVDRSNASESSMNTPRMDTLTSLIENPTKHVVQKYVDDVTYERAKENRLMKEITTMNEEGDKGETSQKQEKSSRQRKEADRLRREAEYRKRLSGDDESNGSYAEILAHQEKKKRAEKEKKNKENKNKNKEANPAGVQKLGDSADTLYSIPEDTTLETISPSALNDSELMLKAKRNRRRHVIDPLMVKLHDKVRHQRDKIDKERKKEMRRMDKLKKLEMLLSAKQKGKLSDKAIGVELDLVSLTTSVSMTDSSTLLDTDSTLTSQADSNIAAVDTTSSKDSSIDVHRQLPNRSRQVSFQEKGRVLAQGRILKQNRAPTQTTGMQADSESQNEDSIFHRPFSAKQREEHFSSEKRGKKKGKKGKTADIYQEPKISLRNKENVERFLAQMEDDDIYGEEFEKPRKLRSPSSRKHKSVSTMYPSPIHVSPPRQRSKKSGRVTMVSEAVQTSPYVPSHNDRGVIPVPLMSPERRRKHISTSPTRSSSRSPARQRSAHISVSPLRSRSRSKSLEKSRTTSFEISMSPDRSTVKEVKRKPRSPVLKTDIDYGYLSKAVPPPKSRMFTPETPEDTCIAKLQDSPERGVSWYIPLPESRPWRQPLKEQQAHAVKQKPWQPKSMHPADWKAVVGSDILNKSRDTKFDLDTKGHRIGDRNMDANSSDEENYDSKPLTKMSLQEAFKNFKQNTISRVGERQKRVQLAAHERQLQQYLEQERKELFNNQGNKKESNPEAHPYSENLHKPKRRSMSKREMKDLTNRLYKKLPEVQAMKYVKKRDEDYSLNRLRARVFNRKIQRNTLKNSDQAR
ncbi:uncharacterized protein LOC110466410 isoform X2 [Mizuhopecten yessoensis]|uniref:uncharacterized protein LOC110466410 isoform X2 n=1 Tax=Mizuhopecten yessoensis TaxID=6573 RepID=UPI000B45F333|nr:uncharacterized protein LOC110466410 isoform X2 [Mizuhopecten yessoensis]